MKSIFCLGLILFILPIPAAIFSLIKILIVFISIAIGGEEGRLQLVSGISEALIPLEMSFSVYGIGIILLIVYHLIEKEKLSHGKDISKNGYWPTMLLCVFLGFLGGHHFYNGRMKMGIFYLFTLGGLLVGKFIDFILISKGSFLDSEGKYVILSNEQTKSVEV